MKKPWLLWLPLALFGLFFGIVAYGLMNPAERTIDSKLVGKSLPEFSLPAATAGIPGLTHADLAQGGEPRLLNIFASWCLPCIAEAPVLEGMAAQGVQIDAIAIRDRPEDVAAFLARNGNPYKRIGSDVDSRVQLALGSSGVPETFVIDGKGVIRYQHIGDIRADQVPMILDQLRKAR
jgi:cytochrome c biogenesis protein CcmG/thiol:disulfide interchange protein DsbE